MNKVFSALLGMAALLVSTMSISWAAESSTPAPQSDQAFEQRLHDLESRVKALEDQMAQKQRHGMLRNWDQMPGPDDMIEQFRRQLEGEMGQNEWEPQAGQKVRLGVSLAAPSEELSRRLNNDVSSGAVVLSVVPGSPAEKAGLIVGDAVIAFDKKDVKSPDDLIAAVRAASKGQHELMVLRKNQHLELSVELGEEVEAAPATGLSQQGPWLRRANPQQSTGYSSSSRTEVRASALELDDALAKELKLTDEQRQKMSDVLAKENKALSDDVTAGGVSSTHQHGSFGFRFNGDVTPLVDKHVAAAEKELTGVLNDQQMKTWRQYRQRNNSVSFSQSIEESGAPE